MASLIYDVTKAPYNADNTGIQDATSAIQSAINQAISDAAADRSSQHSNNPDTNPQASPPGVVIYLPAGTYKVNSSTGSTVIDSTALYTDNNSNNQAKLNACLQIIGKTTNYATLDMVVRGDGVSSTYIDWLYPVSNYGTTATNVPSNDTAANLFGVVGSKVEFRDFSVVGHLSSTFGNSANGYANATTVHTTAKNYGNPTAPNSTDLSYAVGAAFYFRDYPATPTFKTGIPGGNYRLENLLVYDAYIGVHFDNAVTTGESPLTINTMASQVWINQLDIANTYLYGIIFNKFGGNVYIDNCEISGGSTSYVSGSNTPVNPWDQSVGLRLCQGDGYQVSNGIFTIQGYAGLVIQPNPSYVINAPESQISVVNAFFSQVQFDVTTTYTGGAAIVNGQPVGQSTVTPSFVALVEFSGCHFTASGNHGLILQSCSQIAVNNCSAYGNCYHGLFVGAGASFVNVNGGRYVENSQYPTANRTYDGIYVSANVTDFSILGVDCSSTEIPNIVAGSGRSQRFGITVGSTSSDGSGTGSSDRYTIADCDVSGYQGYIGSSTTLAPIYGINDRGNGFDKRIHHNRGHNPLGAPPVQISIPQGSSNTSTAYAYAFQFLPTPQTGVATQNYYGVDATVYVKSGSAAVTVTLAPVTNASWNYTPQFTVPANSLLPFRLPANASITPTWSGGTASGVAPTWSWVLE